MALSNRFEGMIRKSAQLINITNGFMNKVKQGASKIKVTNTGKPSWISSS